MIAVPSHYTEWFNQNMIDMRVRCIRNITNKAADFDRIVTGESLTAVAKRLGETNWVTKQKFLKHYQVITKDHEKRNITYIRGVTGLVERNREYMENEEYIFHRQGLEVIRYGIPEWEKPNKYTGITPH